MRDSSGLVRQTVFTLLMVVSGTVCAWPIQQAPPVSLSVVFSLAQAECGQWGYSPSDLNRDCWVNMEDLAIFLSSWLSCSTPFNVDCENYGPSGMAVVDKPDLSNVNDHYVSNRAPLAPSVLIKLPVGAVEPRGWLLRCLERQRDGMTGHLHEISAWLQKTDNAWLSTNGQGQWGWEEVPYWLKGYANLGYVLKDPAILSEAMVWIEGALNCRHANGDFGPLHYVDGGRDYWANMVMLFCLQSYYEYSRDPRVLDLMTDYFQYQLNVPDSEMLTGYWQYMRGGDNLYSIYWLYNHTGHSWLLQAADKIHRNTANWKMSGTLPNWHNVNIAQGFREPAVWYLQSNDSTDLQAAYNNFAIIRNLYGQVPGGMFGSDENCRTGYDDPHQAIETCGLVEQMLSDELLMGITGDPFWADHCELVAFNMFPAALMPDFKALRYFTAPNMVTTDRSNHSPGIQNAGAFLMMNPLSHRCCQHNHSHGWPYFSEHLWMATPDNGVCAALYAANKVTVTVGDGTQVAIEEETLYPFEDQVRFTVTTPNPVAFPFYMRIPNWCANASVRLNHQLLSLPTRPGKYIKINRTWSSGDTMTLKLPMQVDVHTWTANHNSVSVNYGPLTFSLKIDEQTVPFDSTTTALGDSRWQSSLNTSLWPAYEIHPNSPWNWGLVLDAQTPENSLTMIRKAWPADDFPFTPDAVPMELQVTARQIPEWAIDQDGLCGILQDSPVKSTQPAQTVNLIPMGAARLRISALPVIGDGPDAHQWLVPLDYNPTASHCYASDTVLALCDQRLPSSSADLSIPRMTFWDHKGTAEWVQYTFDSPMAVSSVAVYWFDDTGIGQCRIPASWRLLYWNGSAWIAVTTSGAYGVQPNQFNEIAFDEVTTTSLRLEVTLQTNYSGGILEWQVN